MAKLIFFAVVCVLGLVGSVFLIAAAVLGKKYKQRVENCTHKTTARVLEMRRVISRDHYSTPTTSWFPVYEYYVGKQRIEKQSSFGQGKQIFYDGQMVELFYNPSDWNEYFVPAEKSEKVKWIMGLVGGILLACALIAVMVYVLVF